MLGIHVIIHDEEEISKEEEEEEENVTGPSVLLAALNRDVAAATCYSGTRGPMPESKTLDSSNGSATMIHSLARWSPVVTRHECPC